jgi:hypothetical protein
MKSNEDGLYIKIIKLNEIYVSIVDKLLFENI